MSLSRQFATWPLDADGVGPALVWDGIRRHGLLFVPTWAATPDNWLFSLVPPTAVLTELFGHRGSVPLLLGWFVLLSNVALTARLAARLVPGCGRVVALALLLVLNGFAIGGAGFLGHPVSHGITTAFGLAALLAAGAWFRTGQVRQAAAALGLLAVGTLSDPWALAAFVVPTAVGAAAVRRMEIVFLAVAVAVLAKTQAFGALSFLPAPAWHAARWAAILDNGTLLARSLALAWSPVSWPPILAVSLVGVLAALACRSLRSAVAWNTERRFLAVAAVVACGVPMVAFVSGDFLANIMVARFAMPALLLLPALLAVASLRGARAPAAYLAAMAVAGLLHGSWLKPTLAVQLAGAPELQRALAAHGLTYGYGPYFGVEANLVTWLDPVLRLRPVVFDPAGRIAPRRNQTSADWYRPADVPPGTNAFFVAITAEPDGCPDIELCRAGLQQQFGPADERLVLDDPGLPYRPIVVLVWRRSPAGTL